MEPRPAEEQVESQVAIQLPPVNLWRNVRCHKFAMNYHITNYVSRGILNYYGLMMLAKDKLGSMKNVARVLFE